MTLLRAVLVALALGGCAMPGPSTAPAATTESAAAVPSPPRAAADLLACDAPPSSIGGRADDFGPDGGGATPDDAFNTWIVANPFPIPRSGYDRLGSIGDRWVYVYATGGEVKVVVVISPRFAEPTGPPFTVEELRTCEPSEYGAEADLGPDRRAWVHETTGPLLTDIAGPGHCGWESARMLHVEENGALARQYIRDPEGVIEADGSLRETYASGVELPDDAAFSGYRTADGMELWFTTSDTAAYIVTPTTVERWPRADPPIGCV